MDLTEERKQEVFILREENGWQNAGCSEKNK